MTLRLSLIQVYTYIFIHFLLANKYLLFHLCIDFFPQSSLIWHPHIIWHLIISNLLQDSYLIEIYILLRNIYYLYTGIFLLLQSLFKMGQHHSVFRSFIQFFLFSFQFSIFVQTITMHDFHRHANTCAAIENNFAFKQYDFCFLANCFFTGSMFEQGPACYLQIF